jgi:prolyl-tRNA synthetase
MIFSMFINFILIFFVYEQRFKYQICLLFSMVEEKKGITVKKEENISQWYTEVITKGDLIDYSDVSGCMIFKPYSYAIWEIIQKEVDLRYKKTGIKNCYFPLFIPEKHLMKEAEHIEGFAPEVAWVTHTGNTKLSERLAVRPTSETIMYPSFSKWIRSWRDLPLRLNQWNNVVRWEFKNPVPFMRSREFLWTEGHTVFATKKEAEAERDVILGIYQDILKNYLAIYGVAGYKSDSEKFAGAEYTCSIESFLESGKAIQGPDFHHDGQKFAKAFDITFLDEKEQRQYAWQNTFAITTRMIGVMVMMHGDNKGLVLPPFVAPTQIVIVPIFKPENKIEVLEECSKLIELLKEYRVELDVREEYSPGWKFNEWELKGVPLRIEIGPKDIAEKSVITVRRDTGDKAKINISDIHKKIPEILNNIHSTLYDKSKKAFISKVIETNNFEDVRNAIEEKKMAFAPFCNDSECEKDLKGKVEGLTTRCSPLDSVVKEGSKCINCNKDAKLMIYFAKSY